MELPVDHNNENKSERLNQCLYFAKELKKSWNLNVKVIPILIRALRLFIKN